MPPVIIHVNGLFHEKKHPAFGVPPMTWETPISSIIGIETYGFWGSQVSISFSRSFEAIDVLFPFVGYQYTPVMLAHIPYMDPMGYVHNGTSTENH